MNLVPFNFLCVRAEGDVGTLPLMHPDECLAALQLHPHEEMVISSEDG